MAIHFQTFRPDTCECEFEQEFDDTDPNLEVTAIFCYNVCEKHRPIAEAVTSKISQGDIKKKRSDILEKLNTALAENRQRNLTEYDNHPFIRARWNAIKEMKKDKVLEMQSLRKEVEAEQERINIVRTLDDHESKATDKIITAIYSDSNVHAFAAAEVFQKVRQEQDAIAKRSVP